MVEGIQRSSALFLENFPEEAEIPPHPTQVSLSIVVDPSLGLDWIYGCIYEEGRECEGIRTERLCRYYENFIIELPEVLEGLKFQIIGFCNKQPKALVEGNALDLLNRDPICLFPHPSFYS